MMRAISYILAIFLLSSCASIMNQPTTKIKISSDNSIDIAVGNDNYKIEYEEKVHVKRQKDSLIIIARQDSLTNTFILKPKNSFNYYANVLSYGLGFIWDSKSEKRYTYQRNLYLDFSSQSLRKFRPNKKGQLDIQFSLPHINTFYLQPQNESTKSNTGFWGITGGLEYYYKDNKSLGLSISAVSDFFVPFPAAVDISGEYELMSSTYISLTDNLKIRDFSIGYGINYSKNNWDLRYYDAFDPVPPTREPVFKSSQSFGLTLNSYYRLGKHFNIGVIYRPNFIRIKPSTDFVYEHLISVDFAWKWKIKN
jgi:hypothetical protein